MAVLGLVPEIIQIGSFDHILSRLILFYEYHSSQKSWSFRVSLLLNSAYIFCWCEPQLHQVAFETTSQRLVVLALPILWANPWQKQEKEISFDLAHGFREISVYHDEKARLKEPEADACSHPGRQETEKAERLFLVIFFHHLVSLLKGSMVFGIGPPIGDWAFSTWTCRRYFRFGP